MTNHKYTSSLLKTLLILSAFILPLIFPVSAKNSSSADIEATVFRKLPYLIYNGQNSEYEILWQLTENKETKLAWGFDTTYSLDSVITSEYNTDHQYKYIVTNLIPGHKYYYRVRIEGESWQSSFSAAPPDSTESVGFIAYGDTRSHPESHDKVADAVLNVLAGEPRYQTIVLQPGDLVTEGDQETYWDNEFFNAANIHIRKLLGMMGYQSAVGNHERDGLLFNKYFPYPYVERCYWSFDYGPMHVIVVDQYIADYDSGTEQINWIENDLKNSNKKWKIFLLHKTGWSTGHHGSNEKTQELLQPLCEKYGVKLLIGGHNHLYARALANGVYHITTGGGGASAGDPNPDDPKIIYTTAQHHFCKVNINHNDMNFEVINDSGNIIDNFIISLDKIRLETAVKGPGSIRFTPVNSVFNPGEVVLLEAVPQEGCKFYKWSGDLSGNINPVEITMNYDRYIKAEFIDTTNIENEISVTVSSSSDDAEEYENGSVSLTSSDLELVYAGSEGKQTVGMRFNDVFIHQGAKIANAYIQFTTDETGSGADTLLIKGELNANASTFAQTDHNISNRPTTSAGVVWTPPDWLVVGETGEAQRTPSLTSVIQEIVNLNDWNYGNSLAIIITGKNKNKRTAESYNGESAKAPKLYIELADSTTAINKEISQRPLNFELKAYPNPFNPTVNLQFSLQLADKINITIYNLNGRKVEELTNRYYAAGRHRLKWNAKNVKGQALSSGLYIVTIKGTNFRKSKKIILMK